MKKTLKKAISILLITVMVFGTAPLAGFIGLELPKLNLFTPKVEAATDGYYTYSVSNGEAMITNVDASISGDVIIPSTLGGDPVTSIGNSAFYECDSLTSIIIPDSVTLIGRSAFYKCDSLRSITIPDGVTSIGASAFMYCESLASITIPDRVTNIADCAFEGCTSLESVKIGKVVTGIGYCAFVNCTSLASITIPDSVTSIGEGAFYDCTSLANITIPESVTNIGDSAFGDCTSLTSITVDSANTAYSNDEYGVLFNKDKTKLIQYPVGNTRPSYIIPGGVKIIGYSAFFGCKSLTSITIPDGVTIIGQEAFWGCTSLTSITIPDSITRIIGDAFYNTGYYKNSSNWKNGVLYIGNHLIDAENNISGLYIIKDGTKTIADNAFYNCCSLTSIDIPDSVVSIGYSAFTGCTSLTNIKISKMVTSIGYGVFSNCTSLASITIPDRVTSIGEAAFYNCFSLSNVSFGKNSQLTSIGERAFYACESLKTVTIPKNVETIKLEAFKACDNIKNIYYNGSRAEWEEIMIFEGNENLTSATIHYNSTGPDSGITEIPDNIPDYDSSVVDASTVKTPTETKISYGDSIILHVDPAKIPDGGKVEWYPSNDNFTHSVSADGTTCTISPSKSGDTTFTAIVYDADGKIVSADEQTMTSKAGFFDKLIAFFKNLFGLTKTIPEAIKVTY